MLFQKQFLSDSKWQSVPDDVLWRAFQGGEKEALEYIYRQFINDLYNYGMKIKGHNCLVKDCIQELFVDLWKSRGQLSSTDNIRFYLLKALKLKIHHRLKQESTSPYPHSSNESSADVVLSHEAILIQGQLREEQIDRLNQAIRKLPDRQREIIHLLFFEGLSYEKVSEIMAINVRSVYTLAWKALSSLRKTLISTLTFVAMWAANL